VELSEVVPNAKVDSQRFIKPAPSVAPAR